MSRCYTVKGVHIPGCWTCVIYGGEFVSGHHRDFCTCPRPERATLPDPETLVLAALARIEARLTALEAAR